MSTRGPSSEEEWDALLARRKDEKFILRLFVSGLTPRSTEAIRRVKEVCETYLRDYELEVIDIYQQPLLAKEEQVVATPTLIKKSPLPLRRLVGDLSNQNRVMVGLDIPKADRA